MAFVPSAGLANSKGRNGRSQAPYAAPGLLVGRVVAVHRDIHSVDVVLGTAEIARRMRVVGTNVGTRAGLQYLQTPSNTITETLPDGPLGSFNDDGNRSLYALVHFIADDPNNPVVIGFLPPHISQMMFDRPGFRIDRHESDLYTHTENGPASTYDSDTDTTIPDFEWYHPSGLFLRVGQATTHNDLTGHDAQGLAKFRGTANANTALGTAGPDSADFTDVVVKHPTGTGFTIDKNGNLTLTLSPNATLNIVTSGTGKAEVNGHQITTA